MTAAARYYLRLLVSRQAVLAPVLVYLSVVALNNATPADALGPNCRCGPARSPPSR